MPKVEIRKQCREYAEKFIKIQMDEFKRLGVFADYPNPYKTMAPEYESTIIESFGKIFKDGYIYRSKKPIYWCPTCVTALAEAEVEYDDHTSDSIYVKFKVDPSSVSTDGINKDNLFVIIWTTTPWTLPANLALSFHPDFEYSAFKFGDEYYILAKELVSQMEKVIGKENEMEIPVSIDQIKSFTVHHPFINRESKVISGEHVTLEQGTGVVHTAPGHGHEDYIVGLEYGLDIFCPVDDYGRFTDEFSMMKGVKINDANVRIIDLMSEQGSLLHHDKIEHSYPHCWRCKKPLIFRATEQWFLKIDHNDLREKAMKSIDNTEWVPAWGETRFRGMAETRPDWCLSRQRTWGVPIPSFKCEKCNENMMTPESVLYFAKMSREKGIDIWYTDDIKQLVPEGTTCECGSGDFIKEYDILDVWFDSGVSSFVVLDNWKDHRWPSDIYLEGSDQHRGWFQSSLWPGLCLRGRAPFNTVLTHGFVLDENGKAMSKSTGNVIPPDKLMKQYGADIIRLWVSSEDYRNDLRIGMDMIKQVADSYRRIRNTFKFIIGNLSDFSESDIVSYNDLSNVDKWIMHKTYMLSREVIDHYEKFEFHLVYRKILNFCAVELSSIYFDISKDILYVEEKNSRIRRTNQTALYEIYNTLIRLISPILVFTAEEIWKFNNNTDSIHLQGYYKISEEYNNPEIEKSFEKIVDIKKDILKALEPKRKDKIINTSLEADVKLYIKDNDIKDLLHNMGVDLKKFFQVAKVEILSETEDGLERYDNSHVSVKRSDGKKCVRCWNFTEYIGAKSDHPELCPRCTDIILKI